MSTGSLIPTRGDPVITNTRATTATVKDQDGIIRTALAGEMRMGGFRRVANLYVASEDFTNGAWSIASLATKDSATGISFGALAVSGVSQTSAPVGGCASRTYTVSAIVSVASGTQKFRLWVSQQAVSDYYSADITATTTPTRYSFTHTNTAAAGNGIIGLGIANESAGGVKSLIVTHNQSEDVTGQTIQTPGEYTSVGVLSAPWYGAGVDGVAYFNYLNPFTVASNVVTDSGVRTPISSTILQGLLIEPAATQILATADIRDMTTANWTLGATLTRARTSVGADGVANTATRLTSTGAAATAIITTLITAAATSRTYSALVRRVTGTGVIQISQDNFATNTDVTALVPADGAYHLVAMTQSQLNAVMGFKLLTNTDAIDVDFNQFEAGSDATSRMAATGAARAVDFESDSLGTWYNAALGSQYAEFLMPVMAVGQTKTVYAYNDATANNYIACYLTNPVGTVTTNFEVKTGGVQQTLRTINSPAAGTVVKTMFVFAPADFIAFQNNVATAAGAAGTIPTVTKFELGSLAGANQLSGYERKDQFFPIRMNNAVAQGLTV